MMLVLFAALLAGLAGGYLAGGRVRNLDGLRLVRPWLVVVALLLQVVAFSPLGVALGAATIIALHFASYGLLVLFVALNRRKPGVAVAGVGVGLNLAAIAVNGGHMPASPSALATAGIAYAGDAYNNSGVSGEGTRLALLGDVFATPSWLPMANVFSVGDVLIVVGIAMILVRAMRSSRHTEATAS
jgi:hypothetical protein